MRSGFAQDITGSEAGLFRLLGRTHLSERFTRTPEQGARTSLRVATDPSLAVSGGYFADERLARPARPALDAAAAQQLWTLSERAVGN
ncbi:hypothetical protein [Deinococcus radiotolerans]|uniref:Uncharacterized protein n=1 Tax=Deinococcus radiotolerans TaxID=1309407 RepID=A0ABQ2FL39_9DEIO|nr:hypothetical protein [Deinococcus radiotolerans]GGL08593.1 hypothetical protein GCM10010844_29200 [Deinococcus radiotolerans]